MADCRSCGARLPAGSLYCPECGRPAAGDEPPRPVSVWAWLFDPFVIIGASVAAGGIVLLAGGVWAWGVAVLLVAVVVFLVRRELARPHGKRALAGLRLRAHAVGEAFAARSRSQMELFRARRELAELDVERNRRLRDLGRAVFEDDETGMSRARAAVESVVARIREKEAEIQTLIRRTEEHIQRVHAAARPTEMLEPQGPVIVPEPGPAYVPEPYPPPDEATPPVPDPLPDPVPGPEPDEPTRP